jgi:hypothetical protein
MCLPVKGIYNGVFGVSFTILNFLTMNIIERVKAPTPKFFRLLQLIGLAIASASGVLPAAEKGELAGIHVVLPDGVITISGYVALAGLVISAVSQMTRKHSLTCGRRILSPDLICGQKCR